MKFLTLNIELLFALLCVVKIKGETDWTFDIIEVNSTNQTPDIFDMKVYLKRISRGHFVLDGTIIIGEDITDQTITYSEAFYGATGQYYTRTPFRIPQMPISRFFNTFYKDFVLEDFKECATNPPLSDASETFTPPWAKGVIVLENCTFSNENMPSHMRPGYYKVNFAFTKQIDTMVTILLLIEPK